MMDHIKNFDWDHRDSDGYFIKPEDLDNSVTEKILHNHFWDPLISSDEEPDEKQAAKIDWGELISQSQKKERQRRLHVPGFQIPPRHLKLSALTSQEHYQCLKIICQKHPHIMPLHYIPKPNKGDYQTYERVKEAYEKEQQEYIEWAKTLWSSDQCRRALRPKPLAESVYEAWFRVKAEEMQSFPKTFRLAAQIPLETMNSDVFQVAQLDELVSVNIDKLPEVECPLPINEKLTVMTPYEISEPCPHHPCRFVLPTETAVTDKPLTEVNNALAAFASSHGCAGACSEGAARCLLEREHAWTLPVSVVDVCGADGEPCNVVVLGDDFAALREVAPRRNHRALRHLLNVALVPETEQQKLRYSDVGPGQPRVGETEGVGGLFGDTGDCSDEEDAMVIDDAAEDDGVRTAQSSPETGNDGRASEKRRSTDSQGKEKRRSTDSQGEEKRRSTDSQGAEKSAGAARPEGCTCPRTVFENPPPRTYTKWRLRNDTTSDNVDVIMHCAHRLKVQGKRSELVLEPIPEYQIDLGASAAPDSSTLALALAAMLRRNATVAHVRVDGTSGEVVTFESCSGTSYRAQHAAAIARVANALHTAFAALRGLLPGSYVLRHDSSHGANAMLYADRARSGEALSLEFDIERLQGDEAASVRAPPTLIPALLPIHKHRSLLPLAFTHNSHHVARELRRPATRLRAPPQALQWPKKKGKKKKKNNETASV